VPPLTAAEAAQALGIKVYTIGVGTRGLAPVPRGVDFFGRKVYGQAEVDIDEKTLTAVAQKTGGEYFRADNTDTLRKIYERIDTLEKSEVETKKYVHIKELFHWPVALGYSSLLLEVVLAYTVWRRLP
jgi:Ca-activated chloride channel family protein